MILLINVCFTNIILAENYDSTDIKTVLNKPIYLSFGLNGSNYYVRDEGTSSLIYNGIMYGGNIGLVLFKKNRFSIIEYTFNYGKLNTQYYSIDQNTAKTYCNTLFINTSWQIFSEVNKKIEIYAGPSLNIIGNFRNNSKFNNASLNYEVISSLGPVFYMKNRFVFNTHYGNKNVLYKHYAKREIVLVSSVTFPLFSAIARPTYSIIDDFPAFAAPKFSKKNISYSTIPLYSGTVFKTDLMFTLQNRNIIKLGYTWYFYRYAPAQNKLTGVYSNLSLSFLLRLNNK